MASCLCSARCLLLEVASRSMNPDGIGNILCAFCMPLILCHKEVHKSEDQGAGVTIYNAWSGTTLLLTFDGLLRLCSSVADVLRGAVLAPLLSAAAACSLSSASSEAVSQPASDECSSSRDDSPNGKPSGFWLPKKESSAAAADAGRG